MNGRPTSRTIILIAIAAVVGLAIAYVDSRPTWNDTGVTAGALLVAAFLISAAAGRWPWLWALLVGGWIPLAAITAGRDPSAALALAFAIIGAYAGYAASRAARSMRPVARDD
jgi:hypothetical protein